MKVIYKSVIVKLIVSVLLISMVYIMCKNINNRKEVVLDDVVVKNNITNKKAFAIMLEQDNGEYTESESNTFPTSGYIFNSEKSGCVNINGNIIENALSYNNETNKVNLKIKGSVNCYVYFDIDNSLFSKIKSLSGVKKYEGKVTDRWQDYGTGVDATKVYYVTSNDINNVIFGDFCWKIIRTTETGGTKLLYNGEPTDGKCVATGEAAMMGNSDSYSSFSGNNLYDSPAYVGYMYNKTSGTLQEMLYAEDVNKTSSELKTKIEEWFAGNRIDESKLEDAVYCNDRSLASNSPYSTLEGNGDYTSSKGNVYFTNSYTKTTLECANETDAFSTSNAKAKTNAKVGFMTRPEAELITDTVYNNGSYYWLGSPDYFYSGLAGVSLVDDSDIYGYAVDHAIGVRPVVSLGSSAQLKAGDGSTDKPFKVK